eukprot:g25148.t1
MAGTAQALHEGVALTRDLYKASLDKFGVRPLQASLLPKNLTEVKNLHMECMSGRGWRAVFQLHLCR